MVETKYHVAPALCLDFDGTIRRSKSGNKFIQGPDDIELIPGVEEEIHLWRNNGYLIIGISNQGSVAHGIKTAEEVNAEIRATELLFKEPPFHYARFCFSMETGHVEPWCHRSLFRKPNYGVLAAAENIFLTENNVVVDWDHSLMVGDRDEDKQMAENAGIDFVHANNFFSMGDLYREKYWKKQIHKI